MDYASVSSHKQDKASLHKGACHLSWICCWKSDHLSGNLCQCRWSRWGCRPASLIFSHGLLSSWSLIVTRIGGQDWCRNKSSSYKCAGSVNLLVPGLQQNCAKQFSNKICPFFAVTCMHFCSVGWSLQGALQGGHRWLQKSFHGISWNKRTQGLEHRPQNEKTAPSYSSDQG